MNVSRNQSRMISRGQKLPTNGTKIRTAGGSENVLIQRPTPPMGGQVTKRDQIPFPDRAPLGRSTASDAGAPPREAIYFFDTQGLPLLWTRDGPVVAERESMCTYTFGPLTAGQILLGQGEWEIARVCITPSLGRSARPRWNVILAPVRP